MVTFTQTKTLINKAQIQEVEELIGLEFPLEYKEHLLKFNGGQCYPNVFSFYENGETTNSSIDWFLAIYEGRYNNLIKEIRMVKIEEKRMPSQILPIAHDPGGNLICISCKGQDFGKVYFWNHEDEVDYRFSDDNDYSNLYLISNSFNEFINGLKEL